MSGCSTVATLLATRFAVIKAFVTSRHTGWHIDCQAEQWTVSLNAPKHPLLTCALHAGFVQNLVQQEPFALVILLAKDQGGDLNQETVQLGLHRHRSQPLIHRRLH